MIMDFTWVTMVVERFYNLGMIDTSQKLNGYDSQNFLIQTRTGESFILKIIPSDEGLRLSHECQLNVMQFLHANGIRCPRVVVAPNGRCINKLPGTLSGVSSLSENEFLLVTLMEFIPGSMLSTLHPVPYYLFIEAGRMLANLHQVAEMYNGDIQPLKDLYNRSCWSLEDTESVKSSLSVIKNEELLSTISRVIDQFEVEVLPVLPRLPCGIIHGDYNDDNIIVSEAKQTNVSSDGGRPAVNHTEEESFSISGVIDWCDMVYSCLIIDIAKALSFMVITDTPDVVETIKHFLRGYSSVRALTEEEQDVLPLCLLQSLVQNTVLALKDHSSTPVNEYLLESVEDYPIVLGKLYALYKEGVRWT